MKKYIFVPIALVIFISMVIDWRREQKAYELFRKYVQTALPSVCKQVIEAKDVVYSSFCKAELSTDTTEKISLLTKFIKAKPEYGLGLGYHERGKLYHDIGKHDLAIKDLSKAIEIGNKKLLRSYEFRCNSYIEQKEFQKALSDINSFIEIDSVSTFGYHKKALIYSHLMMYEEARDYFDKVIEMDRKNANAYYLRGFMHLKLGDKKQAKRDWELTAISDPKMEHEINSLILKYVSE